jgi:hypothetical protein
MMSLAKLFYNTKDPAGYSSVSRFQTANKVKRKDTEDSQEREECSWPSRQLQVGSKISRRKKQKITDT